MMHGFWMLFPELLQVAFKGCCRLNRVGESNKSAAPIFELRYGSLVNRLISGKFTAHGQSYQIAAQREEAGL
jgi:hypothetical protein